MSYFVKAALAVTVSAFPLILHAQDASPPQPELTTATYRAWTLRCAGPEAGRTGKACEIAQGLALSQNGQLVGQIAIGRMSDDQPLRVVVQLPPGVWLPADVRIDTAEGDGITVPYSSCRQFCAAEAELDDALVLAFQQGPEPATLTFLDGTGQPVAISLSLDGFAAAMAAMTSEMADG